MRILCSVFTLFTLIISTIGSGSVRPQFCRVGLGVVITFFIGKVTVHCYNFFRRKRLRHVVDLNPDLRNSLLNFLVLLKLFHEMQHPVDVHLAFHLSRQSQPTYFGDPSASLLRINLSRLVGVVLGTYATNYGYFLVFWNFRRKRAKLGRMERDVNLTPFLYGKDDGVCV